MSGRVIDRELTPAEIMTLQLMENLQRENLNPLDEARSLARLQELLGCSREELSVRTQRSTASICRSFKLLELPADLQALVETGRVPVSIAAELHRCTDAAIQRELAQQVAAGSLTRDEVADSVRKSTFPHPAAKTKSLTMVLAPGMSLRISLAISLKDCEKAVSGWLSQLRDAKRNAVDLAAFAAAFANESGGANN